MAGVLKAPPRTMKALEKEAAQRGLMDKDERTYDKRDQLLVNIWSSKRLGRSIERPSILLVGTSGVGKSSTINHLFDLSDNNSVTFAKTSASTSETRATTEFLLEVDSPPVRFGASALRLALVDTPGFNDTGGTKQDACNFYSIKGMYDKHMNGCKPNLVLILIQATDTRIQGENSNLARSLKCLKALKLVDSRYPNVVAVLTFATALGEKAKRFTKNIALKKEIVKETLFKFLNVQTPVVALENDVEDLEVDGDFTILPDGVRQPQNLYNVCQDVLKNNGDLYGHLIFNEAFGPQKKKITMGKTMTARNADTSKLSKDEHEFYEFFTQAMAGGSIDLLVQEADDFLKRENISDNGEIVTEIQSLVGSLRRIGIQELKDLTHVSVNGLNLKHLQTVSETGKKFLSKIGVKDTIHQIGKESASVLAQGYNVLDGSVVQSQIFDYKLKDSLFGISIPEFCHLKPDNVTKTFILSYDTQKLLIKDRLNHLNVSLDVDERKFAVEKIPGFNLKPKINETNAPDQEISFYLEERLFELSIGNLKSENIVLATNFVSAIKALPGKFDINNAKTRLAFEQFFNRWGHFVVTKAYGGGSVELRINSTKLGLNINAIKGSLMKSMSAGFLDADTSIDNNDDWSTTARVGQLLESTTDVWSGGAQELRKINTLQNEHSMDMWKNSLVSNPTMLPTDLVLAPISTFVELTDATKKDAVYEALKNILRGDFEIVAKRQQDEQEKERKHNAAVEEAKKKEQLLERQRKTVEEQRKAVAEQKRLEQEEVKIRAERKRNEELHRQQERQREEKERAERAARAEAERVAKAEAEKVAKAEAERVAKAEAERVANNTRAAAVANNPTPKSKGRSKCFPPQSTVRSMRDGVEITLRLEEIVVGDLVLTYDYTKRRLAYTKLILWADADFHTPTKYFKLDLEDGSSIKLTEEHLIFVDESHRAIMAKNVKPGDLLYKADVGYLKVRTVRLVTEKGLCGPITGSGTILVDGILASCYANLTDMCVFGKVIISAQLQGKTGFAPLLLYRKFTKDKTEKLVEFEGLHPYVASLIKMFRPLVKY